MKWGRKQHHRHKHPTDDNEEDGGGSEPIIHMKKQSSSSSSSFSLSNLLPLSSWLSKLKHHSSPKTTPPIIPHNPLPIPNLSPPQPLPIAPRRLSVGEDETHLTRTRTRARTRTHSLGSQPEFPLLLDPVRTRTRRRTRRPAPDPDPLRPSPPRRSFGARVRPRVRVHSPRLAHPNPTQIQKLESFAVVKRSTDPMKDFRESMVEMIWEKGIGRPDELESLLACYLSLNSDEHHDVIVKVFRQVWFDLNRVAGRIRVRVDS